jgi:hypothetical protein
MKFPGELTDPPQTSANTLEEWIKAQPSGERLVIQNRTFRGVLDLSHRLVEHPLAFFNCTFLDAVDLRYARFCHTVRFDYCDFRQEFNSGDERQSYTVYEKDLHFHGCMFRDNALFNGVTSNGSLYCTWTSFQDKTRDVDFGGCSFKLCVEFDHVNFHAGFNLNGAHCGLMGAFSACSFLSPKGEVNFVGATFGKNCQFEDTHFFGPVRIVNVDCGLTAVFERCTFTNPDQMVRFIGCKMGGMSYIECEFFGGANFEEIRCQNVVRLARNRFHHVKKQVVFSYMRIGGSMSCQKCVFDGPTLFNGLRCEGDVSFRDVTFNHLGGTEEHKLKAGRRETRGGVQMKFARVGTNLYLNGATVRGTLNLDSLQVGRALDVRGFNLRGSMRLRNASVHRVSMGSEPLPVRKNLDLRGFTFDVFDGLPARADELLHSQIPEYFSRDPYIQLERFYQRTGNDADARRIYYEGHCQLRERACMLPVRDMQSARNGRRDRHISPPSMTRWTWRQRARTYLNQVLTGYGVHTERLLLPILFTLVIGTVVFWSEGALRPSTPSHATSAADPVAAIPSSMTEHLYSRMAYSVDLFIPVVDLGLASRWTPTGLPGQLYAAVHILIGWLLIPLLIASIAGIVKKQSAGSS